MRPDSRPRMQGRLDLLLHARRREFRPSTISTSPSMPGEAVGIVGRSGCGKSTVALAIMQYMGKNGAITGGEIKFMGRDMRSMSEEELRKIRGSQISMVYQEPMASLNPSLLIRDPAHRSADRHEGDLEMRGLPSAPWKCWKRCACPTRTGSPTPIRISFRAASSSASSSPWRSLQSEAAAPRRAYHGARCHGRGRRGRTDQGHLEALRHVDDLYLAQSRASSSRPATASA